jgi:uncharacterized caspase-like protein
VISRTAIVATARRPWQTLRHGVGHAIACIDFGIGHFVGANSARREACRARHRQCDLQERRVDAIFHDDADLRRLTRVDEIADDLNQAKNLRILVLDACRVNPLADELSRSMELTRGPPVDRGIARMIAPKGMIVSFATQPNQTADDGQGRNSPYTMAFLKNIEAPEEIGAVFHHMTADVYNETQGKQLPESSKGLLLAG